MAEEEEEDRVAAVAVVPGTQSREEGRRSLESFRQNRKFSVDQRRWNS